MDNKKFYWLKLPRGFFKRHDVSILEAMSKEYVLFYLKLLCESIDHEGYLRFSENVPYDVDMLAAATHTNADTARCAMHVFERLGLVTVLDDGTYWMTDVDKMIGKEGESAVRMRRLRERQETRKALPSQRDADVTPSDACVTQEKEKRDKSIEYMTRQDISDDGDEEMKEKKERDKAGAGACACLEENKRAYEDFLFVCEVTEMDIFQDQDRPTQESLARTLRDLADRFVGMRTIPIGGHDVAVADVLDTIRGVLELGDKDDMFVATVREVKELRLKGKVHNIHNYLITTLYERCKTWGAV